MSTRGRCGGRGRGRGRGVATSSAAAAAAAAPAAVAAAAPGSRGEAGASSRPRLIRDYFGGRGSRPIAVAHEEAVVEWVTQASSTQSSMPGPSTSSSSTVPGQSSSSITSIAVPPAGHAPLPPDESPLLFEDEAMGEVLGEALQEAQLLLGPDAQELLGGMLEEEEEGEELLPPPTSLPTVAGGVGSRPPALSQTVAAREEQESQVEGSIDIVPPLAAVADPQSEEGGDDDEEGDLTWVPPAALRRSSEGQAVRHRRSRVRQSTSEPSGRGSAGPSSVRVQQQEPELRAERTQPPVVEREATTQSGRRVSRLSSPVWGYFTLAADDNSVAVCSLCHARVRRGKPGSRVGTSALSSHMGKHHWREWQRCLSGSGQVAAGEGTSALSHVLPPSRPTPTTRRSNIPAPSAAEAGSGSQSSASTIPSSSASHAVQRQPLIQESFDRTRVLPPTNAKVKKLNGLLAKVLALQLLPFQLVDSAPFRQLMEFAVPQWRIPSRHYFATTAVPELHRHIGQNVALSLDHAVGDRVHLTMDAWSSSHGQGRYVSFTAHWVTLQGAGEGARAGAALELVVPPRGVKGSSAPLPTATVSTAAEPPSKRPRCFASVGHRRCQAVLQLVSLGDRRHTATELLAALQAQVAKWLTPRGLQPGMVVSDNGTNILAALSAGNLPHVPCFAHVLNLVVQKFLRTYPGLSGVVRRARKVACHLRRSPTAAASLSTLQRDCGLPPHKILVDSVTRWNSTLLMLERLVEQRRAIMGYLIEHGTSGPTQPVPYITGEDWRQMKQVCRVLAPFEQATKFVSREHVGVNDVLPLVFLLDRTLEGLLEEGESAVVEQERGELLQQGQAQAQRVEEEEEEESDDSGPGQEGEQATTAPIVRGWGDSESQSQQQQQQEDLAVQSGQEEVGRRHLFPMAAHMLRCFRRDPRIVQVKERDDFWVATLLDPRCKGKLGQFVPAGRQQEKMEALEESLLRRLEQAFPQPTAPALPAHRTQQMAGTSSTSRAGDLLGAMRQFYQPEQPTAANTASPHQRLVRMVRDYMGSLSAADSMRTEDPMEYWVARLDTCRELAQYALEVLACPPSSVLSERAFSAAGGVVTDRRNRLSTQSVDRLTFIKMNESWIGGDFMPSAADSRD